MHVGVQLWQVGESEYSELAIYPNTIGTRQTSLQQCGDVVAKSESCISFHFNISRIFSDVTSTRRRTHKTFAFTSASGLVIIKNPAHGFLWRTKKKRTTLRSFSVINFSHYYLTQSESTRQINSISLSIINAPKWREMSSSD